LAASLKQILKTEEIRGGMYRTVEGWKREKEMESVKENPPAAEVTGGP
jgi:hypothetical protein